MPAAGDAMPPRVVRTTRQRVLRWSLVTLGVVTIGLVALVAFVVIQLSGGLPWAFTNAPKATDRNVVAANTAGNAERDQLVAVLESAGAAVELTRVTATAAAPSCREGQHNWKINNDYDLQCDSVITLVLGSARPSESALRTQLLAFHDQLGAKGWQSAYTTTPLTSLKDIVAQPSAPNTPGSRPLLEQNHAATYFKGERGGQGSATISLRFTADSRGWVVQDLDRVRGGSRAADGASVALSETQAFLGGDPNRYIVSIQLTFVTFSG